MTRIENPKSAIQNRNMAPHRSDRLIRHSLLLLTASQATNIANAFFQYFMGRMLSPIEYGSLMSMLGLLAIIGMPLNALSNSLAFCSAKLLEEGRVGAIRPFMWRWLRKITLVGIVIVALGIMLSPEITSFFQLQRQSTFLIAIIVVSLSLFAPVLGGIMQGVQAFGWGAVSGIIGSGARIIASVAFVYWLGRISDWAIVGHGVSVLVGLVLCVVSVAWIFKDTIPAQVDKKVAGYFFGSLIVLAGYSVMMNADILIVKHFFSPETSGIYACASTIGKIAIFLPMPIVGALFPKVVAAGESKERHKRLLIRGILLAGSIIAAVAGGGLIWPQLPMMILYPKIEFSGDVLNYIRFLLLALSPLSLAYIIMNYHMAQSRFRLLMFLPLCALLYLVGAAIWHDSVFQVIAVLAGVNLTGLIVLLIGLLWGNRRVNPADSLPQMAR